MDVKHWAIVTQTHFRRYRQCHVRLLFVWFLFFSPVYAVVKEKPVLSCTLHKDPVKELALRVFLKDTSA